MKRVGLVVLWAVLLAACGGTSEPSAEPCRREGPTSLFSQARIVPNAPNPREDPMDGLRIGGPTGFFSCIGLEDGDVIVAYDDRPIVTQKDSAGFLVALASAPVITMRVRSKSGAERTIAYREPPAP